MTSTRFKQLVAFLTWNGILSLFISLLYRYIKDDFSYTSVVLWISVDTKRFVLFTFIIFFLLLSTAKLQFNLKDKYIKNEKILMVLKYAVILFLSFFVASLANYFFQYFQFMMSSEDTLNWIKNHPDRFTISVYYLFVFLLVLFAFVGNIFYSTFLGITLLILVGFAHYKKLVFRVEPLYPSDFKQMNQLKDVIPMVTDSVTLLNVVISVILIIMLVYVLKYLPKVKIVIWQRLIFLIVSVSLFFAFTYYSKNFMGTFVKNSDISIIKWDQPWNYRENGFVFAFISNMQDSSFPKPDGYSKEKMAEITSKYNHSSASLKSEKWDSPNIIFLMNEAFWDPTLIGKVEFSQDPIKNVRKLMEDYPSGKILSPAFGGATANVEFEALTGFTTAFLNPGVLPYQDMVDNKSFIPSIVSSLEGKGYKSVAIHPYDRYFYKRNRVYETFSFNQYLDQETMENKETSGPLISDESVTREIIDQVNNSQEPIFIHAVTMQNHLPYNPGRYENNTIDVKGLSDSAKSELEVYSEGVKQADAALKLLIDEIEELREPTIVVFWGDHLPALGKDRSVYSEANFIEESLSIDVSKDAIEKKYSETPLLIYSNGDVEHQELGTISPIYLGSIVFDLAGIPKPPFYQFLDQLKSELHGLKSNLMIDSTQKIIQETNERQDQLLEDYKYIQYDLLIGKQYSAEGLFK